MAGTRRQILAALAARLVQIAPGRVWPLPDGLVHVCTSTIRSAVPWGLKVYGPPELPAVAWRDRVDTGRQWMFGGPQRRSLQVALAAYLSASAPASAAREITADLLAAIGSDTTFGGLALYVELARSQMIMQQASSLVAAVQIDLAITYTPTIDLVTDTARLVDEQGNQLTDESGDHLTW